MDVLAEIQKWFLDHCDGEWEHAARITIDSCDNPGWWVKKDIKGTDLGNKEFKEFRTGVFPRNMPQPPWIHCRVESGVFNGAGDAMQLENRLQCFLAWAQEEPDGKGIEAIKETWFPKSFSNHWETREKYFQSLEKPAGIFQPLEKYFPIIGIPAFAEKLPDCAKPGRGCFGNRPGVGNLVGYGKTKHEGSHL